MLNTELIQAALLLAQCTGGSAPSASSSGWNATALLSVPWPGLKPPLSPTRVMPGSVHHPATAKGPVSLRHPAPGSSPGCLLSQLPVQPHTALAGPPLPGASCFPRFLQPTPSPPMGLSEMLPLPGSHLESPSRGPLVLPPGCTALSAPPSRGAVPPLLRALLRVGSQMDSGEAAVQDTGSQPGEAVHYRAGPDKHTSQE